MAKVSVIMPAFNAEKTIGKAIESVLHQTFPDIELLIINDGSTDGTSELVRQYSDERITLIEQLNTGLSGARNTGLENVKGEYVVFLDSDDWYECDYIEKLLSSIVSNNSQLAVCGMVFHKKDGTTDSVLYDIKYESFFDNGDFLSKFETGIMNSVCNKMFETKLLRNHHLRFKNISIVEDLDFNLRYLEWIKRLSFIPYLLYHYDNTNSVLTTKVSADMFENYIHIHAALLSKVPVNLFPIVSSFVYHQYVSICVRYFNAYLSNRMSMKNLRHALDYYLSNPLVIYSLKIYHAKYIREKVLNLLLKSKQIYLLLVYFAIVKRRSL